MKRVAILKNNFLPKGGLEKHAHQLARVFAERGCETLVLTQFPKGRGGSPFEPDPPYEVLSLGENTSWHLTSRLKFDRACREWARRNPGTLLFGFDRISCMTHYLAGDGVHKLYLSQRRYLDGPLRTLSHRLNPKHRRSLEEEKTLFERGEVEVFPNSYMVKEDILEHYDADPARLHVVHNGIEWRALQEPFDRWERERPRLYQELSLDPGRYQFLFLGHGYKRKGLLPLLDGLSRLPADLWQLSVVGREARLSDYQSYVKRLDMEGNVRFFGGQSDTRPFLQVADSLVLPSLYDPFANVTVEALAMGLFVVTSDFNGGKEVLTPESGCIIDSLFNPESVAEALQQALLRPKSGERAAIIRKSVAHLEVASQLNKVVERSLNAT
ncbi:MAG: glycosyltransferase family 4 protein [Parachlamydiales bacterium]